MRGSASQNTMPNNLTGYGVPNFWYAHKTQSNNDKLSQQINFYISNDRLFINAAGLNVKTVILYNLCGQRVFQQNFMRDGGIDLSQLAIGVYFLKLVRANQRCKILK